jgi:hypothetical protein
MTHRPHGRIDAPATLDGLRGHVPDTHIDGAKLASEAFRRQGIRHVLVGGLAVGLHGYPRGTKDIDFLVDDSAFDFIGPLVVHRPGLPISYKGVGIDWVSLEPHERSTLDEFLVLPNPGEVPTMPLEPLIAMKLVAGRHKDQADVVEMLKANADLEAARSFVGQRFPQKLDLLERLIAQAESES